MRQFYIRVVFLIALFAGLQVKAQKIVSYNDTHIRYMGRVGYKDNAAQLYWSGTSVKVNFKGTEVKVLLKDERGDSYYNVIIDGKIVVLHPDTAKRLYTLASHLTAGIHSVELFKRTEWADGTTAFYNFQFNTGAEVLAPPPIKKRKIEFYGNSITSGYAIEDFTGQDSYLSRYKNNYLSYAAITARHFDAEYSCISKSGIGIVIGYYPAPMSEIYNRVDANDPKSLWDFAKYTPDVVVVNLFQNDASLMRQPGSEIFRAKFGNTPPTAEFIIEAYRKFIQSIRAKYPKAQIICALGSMDAVKDNLPWKSYIEKAVEKLNDKLITAHFFPFKNSPGHPTIKEQQDMANDLIKYIDTQVKW